MSQTLIGEFTRFYSDKPLVIFKGGAEDTVVTIEFKNTNTTRASFDVEVLDKDGKAILNKPLRVSIQENRSFKKHNVLCKAGGMIALKSSFSGLAARAYTPALYMSPGQVALLPDETEEVKVYFKKAGTYTVSAQTHMSGISISPASADVSPGAPAVFQVARDATGKGFGQVLFQIASEGLSTILDVGYSEPVDTENPGTDMPFDIDLVQVYGESRDHVTS